MNWLSIFFKWFVSGLCPVSCVECGQEGRVLCSKHALSTRLIKVPLRNNSNLKQVYAVMSYQHKVGTTLIRNFKFNGYRHHRQPLVEGLLKQIPWYKFKHYSLVPIPLHRSRRQQRGFNQSELMAKDLAQTLNLKFENHLKKTVKTRSQASLGLEERRLNLGHVFTYQHATAPEQVILLDDVYTTGSTLESAAQVLKAAGTKRVIGVVVAYTEKED